MNWNKLIRDIHRWLSIVFTVAVIANIVAMLTQKPGSEAAGQDQSAMLVGLLALFPLIVLLFTGLYLFALPYVARWRRVDAPVVRND
ncbi:hypothetical protein [Archangium lansingense]|uniref:Uncharacterized protein n=1 Tax=Archangium lansingense TaxID=2995310 RepID=A0ABT4AG80_9BACT|nr:hypothetical protein [Archangium lansinium]MCY1080693.1 hypothetical protein [Archangium lansinium]